MLRRFSFTVKLRNCDHQIDMYVYVVVQFYSCFKFYFALLQTHYHTVIIIPKHNIYMYFWDIIVWQGKNQTSIRNSTTSSNRSRRLWFVVSLRVFTVYLSLTAKCTYLHVFQVWQIKPVIRDPVNVIVSQNTANHNT